MGGGVDDFNDVPDDENPTLKGLRNDMEAAKERERAAQEELAQAQRAAEGREEEARERQERDRRAAEEREREIQQQFEQERSVAEGRERQVREELGRMHEAAEETKKQVREELGRLQRAAEQREREIQEERERARKAMEDRKRAAQEELERVRRAAKEREQEAQKKLERVQEDLRTGVEGEMFPTTEEIEAAKAKIHYRAENLHFAVCGTAGSGKSSLINAIRGIRGGRAGAAKTGITETTSEIGRFPDHHSDGRSRFVWYDVPGAGTLNIPGWQHFNDQGLYVFDFIIVVIDNRFTKIDLQIIKNCRRFNIPSFIVRSKTDQHIKNLQDEMAPDDDDDDLDAPENPEDEDDGGARIRRSPYELARDKYISETRKNVTNNLLQAELPDQYVYIICQQAIYRLMNGRDAARKIDEEKLLRDLLATALDRRYTYRAGS